MTSPDPLEPPTPGGSAAVEPHEYGPEEAASVLTPMGQVESLGNFACGLGPRRGRIALFGSLAVLLLAELR